MPELLAVVIVATLTVLATGLGALPVLAVGERAERLRPWLDGGIIGVMGVTAVVGLLVPAVRDGDLAAVALGALAGGGGLTWARHRLQLRAVRLHHDDRSAEQAQLTFGVLFVHSLPEGLALGSAMAAEGSLATFVVLAIAIQNIPEGTATAVALLRAGKSPRRQVGAAILTSVPQIPGAVLAWLAVGSVAAVLPAALAAAGTAMLLLVLVDLVPAGWRTRRPRPVALGALVGGGLIGLMSVVLGGPG